VTSRALDPPLSQNVTLFRTPPFERDVLYGRPQLIYLNGTDSPKTSVSLLIPLTNLLTSLILRSHSPLLPSSHDLRPNFSSYSIPILGLHLRHYTSAIAADYNAAPGANLDLQLGEQII